jgi:lipoprotein signal peptidase
VPLILDQGVKAFVLSRAGNGVVSCPRSLFGRRWLAVVPAVYRCGFKAGVSRWFFLAAFALASAAVVGVVSGSGLSGMAIVGWGLAIGGAAGNIVDRFVRGGVVDFLVVGRWPAFNVADAAIVAGVVVATVGVVVA